MSPLNNRRIVRNSLSLYFRMLFTLGVNLYTSRVVLQILGIDDYGIYNVVGGVVALLGFLNGAMINATQRYLTFKLGKGDIKGLNDVFSMSILIHVSISLLLILIAETLGLWFLQEYINIPEERITAAFWVFQFSILSMIATILNVPYTANIIAHEKMQAFAYISILEVTLKLLMVFSLYLFPVDKLQLYALFMSIIQLLIFFIYTRYCKTTFPNVRYHFVWYRSLFNEMLRFVGWNLIGNLSAIAFTHGVNILLNIFFSPAVNAARGIAVQVQGAINGFCQNFQTALNPQIIKSYASNDKQSMFTLVFASSKFSFYLLFFFSLPLMLEAPFVLKLWLGTVPEHTISFVRLMLGIIWVDSLANPLLTSAMATGKIKYYQIAVGSLLLTIVPLSYIVLKNIAIPELVFVVHLIIAICALTLRLYFVHRLISLPIDKYWTLVVMRVLIVLATSIFLPLAIYLYLPQGLNRFICVCIVSLLSVSLWIYLLGLEKWEKVFLRNKIKEIKQRIIS